VRETRSLGSARGAPGNRGPYRKRVESHAVNLERLQALMRSPAPDLARIIDSAVTERTE